MVQPVRQYKDLDLSLTVHPNTNDLVYLKNEDAIKRAVKNILLTNFDEKHFLYSFGCNLRDMLFEPMSFFSALSIQQIIEETLIAYEPRINLIEVAVNMSETEDGYDVMITFQVLNSIAPVTVDFFLERVR